MKTKNEEMEVLIFIFNSLTILKDEINADSSKLGPSQDGGCVEENMSRTNRPDHHTVNRSPAIVDNCPLFFSCDDVCFDESFSYLTVAWIVRLRLSSNSKPFWNWWTTYLLIFANRTFFRFLFNAPIYIFFAQKEIEMLHNNATGANDMVRPPPPPLPLPTPTTVPLCLHSHMKDLRKYTIRGNPKLAATFSLTVAGNHLAIRKICNERWNIWTAGTARKGISVTIPMRSSRLARIMWRCQSILLTRLCNFPLMHHYSSVDEMKTEMRSLRKKNIRLGENAKLMEVTLNNTKSLTENAVKDNQELSEELLRSRINSRAFQEELEKVIMRNMPNFCFCSDMLIDRTCFACVRQNLNWKSSKHW